MAKQPKPQATQNLWEQAQQKIQATTESVTAKVDTSKADENRIIAELGVLKAQNDVLLALIKGYFDFNTQALTTATTILNEGIKAFKSHDDARFELKRTECELRMNIEQLKVENEFEIEKAKIELEHRRLANIRFAARAQEEFNVLELNLNHAQKEDSATQGKRAYSKAGDNKYSPTEKQAAAAANKAVRDAFKKQAKGNKEESVSLPSLDEIAKSVKASVGNWDGNFDAIKDTAPIYIETKVDTDKIVKRGRKKIQK